MRNRPNMRRSGRRKSSASRVSIAIRSSQSFACSRPKTRSVNTEKSPRKSSSVCLMRAAAHAPRPTGRQVMSPSLAWTSSGPAPREPAAAHGPPTRTVSYIRTRVGGHERSRASMERTRSRLGSPDLCSCIQECKLIVLRLKVLSKLILPDLQDRHVHFLHGFLSVASRSLSSGSRLAKKTSRALARGLGSFRNPPAAARDHRLRTGKPSVAR